MIRFFIYVVLAVLPLVGTAAEKEFEREYTYRASDDDSKNSARDAALKALRSELLLEVGVFIESYLQIDVVSDDVSDREYIREEIKQITGGTTETRILDERWDGSHFYVRAMVKVDPNEVTKSINDALIRRSKSAELARMRKLLISKDADIAAHSADLSRAKRSLRAKEAEVASRSSDISRLRASVATQRRELALLQSRLSELNAEQSAILSKRNRILRDISAATRSAETMVSKGMTVQDVYDTIGLPRSRDDCLGKVALNYGTKWLIFEGRVVRCAVESSEFKGACYRQC